MLAMIALGHAPSDSVEFSGRVTQGAELGGRDLLHTSPRSPRPGLPNVAGPFGGFLDRGNQPVKRLGQMTG